MCTEMDEKGKRKKWNVSEIQECIFVPSRSGIYEIIVGFIITQMYGDDNDYDDDCYSLPSKADYEN